MHSIPPSTYPFPGRGIGSTNFGFPVGTTSGYANPGLPSASDLSLPNLYSYNTGNQNFNFQTQAGIEWTLRHPRPLPGRENWDLGEQQLFFLDTDRLGCSPTQDHAVTLSQLNFILAADKGRVFKNVTDVVSKFTFAGIIEKPWHASKSSRGVWQDRTRRGRGSASTIFMNRVGCINYWRSASTNLTPDICDGQMKHLFVVCRKKALHDAPFIMNKRIKAVVDRPPDDPLRLRNNLANNILRKAAEAGDIVPESYDGRVLQWIPAVHPTRDFLDESLIHDVEKAEAGYCRHVGVSHWIEGGMVGSPELLGSFIFAQDPLGHLQNIGKLPRMTILLSKEHLDQ